MRWIVLAGVCGLAVACSSQGGSECDQDADCAPGYHCRQGACVYDCTVDAECPDGFICTARGRCERGCSETNGGVEACDGVDNDCDGETDEGVLNRCGTCEPPDEELVELCGDGVDNDCDGETEEGFERVGTPCDNQGCAGEWICSDDKLSEACDAPEPAAEDATCDGVDDDCDGATDEDAGPRACPLQEGVCAGAGQNCLPGGAWSDCDYGPVYTEGTDAVCDQMDSDCDGETDEDAAMVPQPEAGAEASDGLDNNCNGLVDEPGGLMVLLPHFPGVAVDVYEIGVYENADCSGAPYGVESDDYPAGWPVEGTPSVALYACSLGGVMPSGYLSWHRARWACEAQGKRLCSSFEWVDACSGVPGRMYPYGSNFVPGACNDAWQFGGEPEAVLAATGVFDECLSESGTWDMSGNLNEWVQDWDTEEPHTAWTGGGSYVCELCDAGVSCAPCIPGDEEDLDDIDTIEDCRVTGKSYEKFPRNDARSYLGTRCCMDVP